MRSWREVVVGFFRCPLGSRLLPGIALGAVVLAGGALASAPSDRSVFPYPIQTVELDNGLHLVMVEMPTPGVVHYQTVVRVGSRNELEPGRTGYAHFFEHMMFRGTRRFPEDRYREILGRLGADHNASTNDDQTSYYLTIPADAIATVIALEADRFRNLEYTREQFRKEAGAVLGEFTISRSSPGSILEERRLELGFREHPYGHSAIGLEDDVRAMPDGYRYSLLFYDRYYKPENCVILVAGDIETGKVERLVRAAYGDWPRGDFVPAVPVEPPLAGPVRDDVDWSGPTRPILEISFRTPAFDESRPVTAALELIAEIFFGSTSDLYRDLVEERSLLESLGASFERRRDPYLFIVTARLRDSGDLRLVERRIDEELEVIRSNTIDPERLLLAQRRKLASLALSLETAAGVGWRLSGFLSLTGDPSSLERHFENVASVTPGDLREAASLYLVPSRSVRLTLVGQEAQP